MSDFSLPDFRVPELRATDLTMPDFTMPDASMPDPPSPDLMQPAIPPELDMLASSASSVLDAEQPVNGIPVEMPGMQNMQGASDYDRPGTLDSSAQSLVMNSPDNRQLPAGLTYDALHSTGGMTSRERHLGTLLLGLEGKVPTEGTRQ